MDFLNLVQISFINENERSTSAVDGGMSPASSKMIEMSLCRTDKDGLNQFFEAISKV